MSDEPQPVWAPIWLRCASCKHDWDDWQPEYVPIDTWAAHVKTYHCPACGAGAKHVLWRRQPLETPDPAGLTRGVQSGAAGAARGGNDGS